jgi:hypothetical protein
LKCRSNRYLKSNTCVTCEKEGVYIYLNSNVPECRDCDTSCIKCESNTKCLECSPDKRLVWASNGLINSCDDCADCDVNLPYDRDCYLDRTDMRNCINNCKLCSNHNQCKTCLDGYFLEDGGSCCTKCPDNCDLCIGENFCTKCLGVANSAEDVGDYYLFGGHCLKQCAAFSTYVFPTDIANAHTATYSTGMEKCKLCPPNCQACPGDSTTCQTCDPGYFLLQPGSKSCVTEEFCKIGYRQKCEGGKDECEPCTDKWCLECPSSPSICTKCKDSWYLDKTGCGPQGTCTQCTLTEVFRTQEAGINVCMNCPEGCETCSSDSVCKKCLPGLYRVYSDTCVCTPCSNCDTEQKYTDPLFDIDYCLTVPVTDCKDPNCLACEDIYTCQDGRCKTGYYLGYLRKCLPCEISHCDMCLDNTKCLLCSTNFYLFNNGESCVPCVRPGEIATSETTPKTCSLCVSNCLKCDIVSACKVCNQGYYLLDYGSLAGNCVLCDMPGNFVENDMTCVLECQANCQVCKSACECLTCKPSYYLNTDGSCSSCSIEGSFKIEQSGVCVKECVAGCKVCDSPTICKECKSTHVLTFPERNECRLRTERSCECEGLVEVALVSSANYVCYKCLPNCVTCSDDRNCLSCIEGYYLSGNKCEKCLPNCQSCITKYTCGACATGFFPNSDKSACLDCTLDASSNPKILGMFKDGNVCKKCIDNCKKCSTDSTCLVCHTDWYLKTTTNLCVRCIEKGELKFGATCSSCIDGCDQCDDDCTCKVCQKGKYLKGDNLCTDCVGEFHYKKEADLDRLTRADIDAGRVPKCIDCPTHLCRCTSETWGIECSDDTKVIDFNDRCECTSCTEQNQYKDGLLCYVCDDNCACCNSKSTCEDCKPGYFLKKDSKCEKCEVTNCAMCNSYDGTVCSVCASTYVLYREGAQCILANTCIDSNKKILSGDLNSCYDCPTDCSTCCENLECNTCPTGTGLLNGRCILCAHLPGYFLSNGICAKCKENCRFCKSSTECEQCMIGFGLPNCERCEDNCAECTDCVCTKCKSDYFLSSAKDCVKCDQTNQVQVLLTYGNQCKSCPENCAKCGKEGHCYECNAGYYVLEDSSCTKCTNGNHFLVNNIKCAKCDDDDKCELCLTSTKCKVCSPGYYLQANGKCTCTEYCTKCDNLNKCSKCGTFGGFAFKLKTTDWTCTECCEDGYMVNGGIFYLLIYIK